ncbi:MAG: hypothetical protein AAB568_01370 [Patescibacteria group bacterium]
MDRRKILFITIFSLAILVIIYGLYYFFYRQPVTAPMGVAPEEAMVNAPAGGLPTAGIGAPPGIVTGAPSAGPAILPPSAIAKGGVTLAPLLVQGPVFKPFLGATGKLNYYDPAQGKFYRVGTDGQPKLMSNQTFYNVQNVTWSPQSDKGIIEYPDKSKIFYDFTTGRQTTLPKHWEGFDFAPQGDKVVAKSIGLDSENRWLLVSNPDGSEAKTVRPLGDNADKVQVAWSPAGGVLAFSDTGKPRGGSKEIIPLGENNERFNPLVVEGYGFQPKWSTGGDKLVYSVYNNASDYKPELWITNAQGAQMGTGRRKLDVVTWAEKCVFQDNDTMICAVPQDLPTGAGLQPELGKEYADSIYKIDLKTGLKNLLATPDKRMSLNNLMVSPDKGTLYFTNTNSGELHTMKLQ